MFALFLILESLKFSLALESFSSSFLSKNNSTVTTLFDYNYYINSVFDLDSKLERNKCQQLCNHQINCNSFVKSISGNRTYQCLFYSSNPLIKNGLLSTSSSSTIYIKSYGSSFPTFYSMSTIQSDGLTNWGQWHQERYCPSNSYAIGVKVKAQAYNSFDNTGLNAIEIICNDDARTRLLSGEGSFGDWDTDRYCPYYKKLIGFKFRVHNDAFIINLVLDDSAANGIHLFCDDGSNLVPGVEGPWGNWGSDKYCANNQVICGIKTQIQWNQGFLLDDTALNNVVFYCCSL